MAGLEFADERGCKLVGCGLSGGVAGVLFERDFFSKSLDNEILVRTCLP